MPYPMRIRRIWMICTGSLLNAFHRQRLICTIKYRPTSYAGGWVAIANQKNYVSLYTCSALHLVTFKAAYPGYKTGKGCINFRANDEIPMAAIENVIRHAIEHPKA